MKQASTTNRSLIFFGSLFIIIVAIVIALISNKDSNRRVSEIEFIPLDVFESIGDLRSDRAFSRGVERVLTLEARGFSIKGERSSLFILNKSGYEKGVLVISVIITILILAGRIYLWTMK